MDTRKLTEKEQELLRIKAVNMVVKHKLTQSKTAELLDVSRVHVNRWCKIYSEEGIDGLKSKKRGRSSEAQMRLTPWQAATICNLIRDHTPEQLKLPFVFWERKTVQELIQRKLNIKLSLSTVGNYLRKWGMTPQKPLEKAYKQNAKAVEQWKNTEYIKIQKRVKQENGEILWGDETSVQNKANYCRSYAPKGKTPIIKQTGKKLRINMISAISNRGKIRFMIYKEKMNHAIFIRFLKRLIKNSNKKIFFITDNLPVHHCKKVKEWIEQNKKSIELFFIPSYSPELNPDEYLNRDLKKNVNAKSTPKTLLDLEKNLRTFMKKIQHSKERVMKYFNSKHIQYAALV